jgi:ABC-type sugar transport system permease subunit
VSLAIALTCAVLLNQKHRFSKVYEVVLFIPYVCSSVAVAIMWRWMFNEDAGIINNILVGLFGEGAKVHWMTDPAAYRWMLFIITIWKDPGYGIIMYKAALKNIDKSLYEAGRIDGANEWQLFKYITFPKLSSTTVFLLLAGIISGMKCFDIAKIVSPLTWTGTAGPNNSGLTLVYYAYLEGVTWDNMSVASVVSWILFVIIFILTYINMKAKNLWGSED